MMRLLSLTVVLSAVTVALPAIACERHQSHASLTVAQMAPPPEPMITQSVEAVPASVIAIEPEMKASSNKTLGAAYEGCSRNRKNQTVYYTQ